MRPGITPESDVEHQGSDDEEAENNDLENQTADDDVRTKLRVYVAFPHACLDPQSSAARLNDETEDVAEHENACEPSRTYYGAMSSVEGADESAKRHCSNGSQLLKHPGRISLWIEREPGHSVPKACLEIRRLIDV